MLTSAFFICAVKKQRLLSAGVETMETGLRLGFHALLLQT